GRETDRSPRVDGQRRQVVVEPGEAGASGQEQVEGVVRGGGTGGGFEQGFPDRSYRAAEQARGRGGGTGVLGERAGLLEQGAVAVRTVCPHRRLDVPGDEQREVDPAAVALGARVDVGGLHGGHGRPIRPPDEGQGRRLIPATR